MDKNKLQTFILNVDDFDQKICTLQSEPNKKYILDDEGKLSEYESEISICAIKLETEGNRTGEESNGTFSDSNEIVQLDDPAQLGLMNSFDGVAEFEQKLMNDLESGYMNMVPNPYSQYIMQHMDIREPLTKLRKLIENRLGVSLKNYHFSLQGVQIADDNKNLVEQCVQGEGIVQVNVHVQTNLRRINIIDVLKPAEDYIHMDDVELDKSLDKVEEETQDTKPGSSKSVVHWQEDAHYKEQQEKLNIPSDPEQWTAVHVRHWVQWAVRRFDLANVKLQDWNMTGKQLQEMSTEDFKKIVPNDPGGVFLTHFELLRKMKVVATINKDLSKDATRNVARPKINPKKEMKVMNYTTAMNCLDVATVSASGNRSGNNGQIQLWQFLLELLTTQEYKAIIQWIGKDGEFKLNHPEVVAHLWGERKNKPTMNYEKLSRALRYYYDGDMISKVQGKRFVYKFVCDLKQLVGYSAIELSNLVKYGNPMGEV